jgi:aconitate hydratase
MGILPLQFLPGDCCASLGLSGRESFSIPVVAPGQQRVGVSVECGEGGSLCFEAIVRIDTPNEFSYFANGGILPYVLRRLAAG